jgi:hypothetical protein
MSDVATYLRLAETFERRAMSEPSVELRESNLSVARSYRELAAQLQRLVDRRIVPGPDRREQD